MVCCIGQPLVLESYNDLISLPILQNASQPNKWVDTCLVVFKILTHNENNHIKCLPRTLQDFET